jgi:hypothetical protein
MSEKGQAMRIDGGTKNEQAWASDCDTLRGELDYFAEANIPPSNDDPVDGAVNADGAVWGEGRWHLVDVTTPHGRGYRGELLAHQAICSCGWLGVQRWMRSSDIEATGDAERHTWAVSHHR